MAATRTPITSGKEADVNGPRLPLPLELTSPVVLTGALEAQFRSAYDARTQLCSSTSSCTHCKSVDHTGAQIDVTVDIQVDDVIA
jgi:hypothetical protein